MRFIRGVEALHAYQRYDRKADSRSTRNTGTMIGGTNHRFILMPLAYCPSYTRLRDSVSSLVRCAMMSSHDAVSGKSCSLAHRILASSLAESARSSCRICAVEGIEKRRPSRRKCAKPRPFVLTLSSLMPPPRRPRNRPRNRPARKKARDYRSSSKTHEYRLVSTHRGECEFDSDGNRRRNIQGLDAAQRRSWR